MSSSSKEEKKGNNVDKEVEKGEDSRSDEGKRKKKEEGSIYLNPDVIEYYWRRG